MKLAHERRIDQRFVASGDISDLVIRRDDSVIVGAILENISYHGIGLKTSTQFPSQDLLLEHKSATIRLKLVWTRPSKNRDGSWESGFKTESVAQNVFDFFSQIKGCRLQKEMVVNN